jgi:hypothetical protein
MPVVDNLAGSKDSWNHLRAVQNSIEARFENTDQILASVTFARCGLGVIFFELLFTNIAVIAF